MRVAGRLLLSLRDGAVDLVDLRELDARASGFAAPFLLKLVNSHPVAIRDVGETPFAEECTHRLEIGLRRL